MSGSADSPLVIVVGDDAVAAGMLALDLVQSGFDAHGAADVWSAIDQLRAGVHREPVLITGFSILRRTLEVARQLRQEGVDANLIAVVDEPDLAAADAAAMAGDWLGVVSRPVEVHALADLLLRHGSGAADEAEHGDLRQLGVAALLEQEFVAARRDPARGTAVVQLESRGRIGDIALVDGELVHAQVEADQGRHALERMFCWTDGVWRLTRGRHTGAHTLTGGWRSIMSAAHEYARRVAEARRTMPLADSVVTVRWERVRPLPIAAEALFRRLARGLTVSEALDGDGDDELEAYAALLTRIRRGAVEPFEQTITDTPSRFPTHTHQRPRFDSAGTRPKRHTHRSGSGVMSSVRPAPAPSQAMRQSYSHRLPRSERGASFGHTMAVHAARAEDVVVDAPAPAGPHDERHSDTSTYRVVPLLAQRRGTVSEPMRFGGEAPPDLPEIPVASVRENTPTHTPVLPATLPDVESDTWQAADVREEAPQEPVMRASGWFGLNVGKGEDEALAANVTAMRDALVQSEEGPRLEDAVSARMSHSVAELPRVAPVSDGFAAEDVDDYYSMFASDDELDAAYAAENERSQLEILVPQGRSGRGARLFWVAALVLVATVLTLVIWPGSPLFDQPKTAVGPEERTYRRAVQLADQGQEGEAAALLRLVHDKVAPEATLQLAVLEVRAKRFEDARGLLKRYIATYGAKRVDDAKRLYTHVYGGAP